MPDRSGDWKKSGRYVGFAGSSTATVAPEATTPQRSIDDIIDIQAELPPVPRPDVPDTEEKAPPAAEDTVLGTVAGWLDNVVPDDMGGIARGTSGWLGKVPGYTLTVGRAADVSLGAGSAAMDAMYWGSEQSDHLMAMVGSWLPGGVDSLNWDQAHNISAGQVLASNTIGNESLFGLGYNAVWDFLVENSDNPEHMQALRDELSGREGSWLRVASEDIDLNKKADRDEAFGSGAGMLISGGGDFLWDIFGDPTIVGGKISSVLRYGTKAGKFGGLTNQSVSNAYQAAGVASRIDDAVVYAASNGEAGKWTTEGEHVRDLISGRDISNNVFVQGSLKPDAVMQLASQIDPADLQTGATLVKALMGERTGLVDLQKRSPHLYDQLMQVHGYDVLAPVTPDLALIPQQEEFARDMVTGLLRAADGPATLSETARPRTVVEYVYDDVAAKQQHVPAGASGQIPLGARTADGSPFPGNWLQDPDPSPIAHLGKSPTYDTEVAGYASKYGIEVDPVTPDFDAVRIYMPRTEAIARDYNALPANDPSPETIRAYEALRAETYQQFEYMTKELGIKYEVSPTDPYKSVAEMVEDVRVNKRIKVLDTATTGSHPFLTDAENNMFRAIHDYFGHAGPGRGFDRHGEEAAWLSHSRMFSPDARRAMTTETRGQNSVVIIEGDFPEQKLALLPDRWVFEAGDPVAEAVPSLITRAGGRSVTAAKAANAWRKGATRRGKGTRYGSPKVQVTEENPLPGSDGWAVRTIEAVAGSRPLRVVRWTGRATPNGIVHLKGGDGDNASKQVRAFLDKSPLDNMQAATLYDEFIKASNPADRRKAIEKIEEAHVAAEAARKGISAEQARVLYQSYASKRSRYLASLRNKDNKFAVDENGELVTTPGLYTELDEAFPLLNQKVMKKVIDTNHGWLSKVEDVEDAIDVLNTYWKLSVLIRLGYTQRNVMEGALRSLAALGTAAMDPETLAHLPSNMKWYLAEKRYGRSLKRTEDALLAADAKIDKSFRAMLRAREARREIEVAHLDALIEDAQRSANYLFVNNAKLSKAQRGKFESHAARIEKYQKMRDDLDAKRIDPEDWHGAQFTPAQQAVVDEITGLQQRIRDTAMKMREARAKRVKTGRTANVMDDGAVLDGAFMGPDGEIASMLSSADRTSYMTFDAAYEARRSVTDAQANWVKMDPSKPLSKDEWRLFWDEYTMRLNQRYRNDKIIQSWAAQGEDIDLRSTVDWLMSPAGAQYRNSMAGVHGWKLNKANGQPSQKAVERFVNDLYERFNREVPFDTGLRQRLTEGNITPGEVAAAFGERTPAAIPVRRPVQDRGESIWQAAKRGADTATGKIMQALGSFPETTLLRHPFYNAVFKAEQQRQWTMAVDRGFDMTKPSVKARMNKAAHAAALKETRSTLYTIENLSNAGEALRWIVPFFPAFENALRTWGRLAYTKPQILGYGALAWNVPNNLGLVVDEYGEPVDRSNMFKDEKHMVVLPQQVVDFVNSRVPDIAQIPGDFYQHGFNVVFPGGEWWWSGVGPMAQTPMVLWLRGKPETADVLRSVLSDNIYNSVVPGGNPNTDLIDMWMSTTQRRLAAYWGDESENSAYATLKTTMVEDAYIKAQLEDRPVTERDIKRALDDADAFWKATIRSAATDFTPGRYVSEYEPQRNYWKVLLDDQSLTWQQKIDTFKEKYPDYMAITRSTSQAETELSPTLATWQKITENPDLVDRLYEIDPSLVGMFGNVGNYDDPFSYSVYGEYRNMKIGNRTVKQNLTPEQIVRNNEIIDGWNEHRAVKALLEDAAIRAGYTSINSKGAEAFKRELEDAEKQIAKRWPAWGDEQGTYTEMLPLYIKGSRILADNPDSVGEPEFTSTLREWLTIREQIAEAKAATNDDDLKREIVALGAEAAAALRDTNIAFADFYDRYLARDDFRTVK